nr:uncharacterized protein LOC111413724 [Onthophagus taurus]
MFHLSKLLTIFLIIRVNGEESNKLLTRSKRYLVYPLGGQVKIVVGVSWPVPLGLKQSMACALNLQFQYPQAQNITQLQTWPPIITRSQEKRSLEKGDRISDRMAAYLGLESILDKYGFDGHQCLLRSICDNAVHPLNHNANGLYGRLLHIFLS